MMKRISRLISTFASTLVLLISTCPTAQAEFKGQMRRDLEWNLSVDNSSTTGGTAVTVYYLGSTRDDLEFRTVPGGDRVQLSFPKPGRGVKRIIIEVDPPNGQTIPVDLNQPPYIGSIAETVVGRGHLVFDVVDAQ